MTGGVQHLDGDVADGDGVAALVLDDICRRDARHPLHEGRLCLVHVDGPRSAADEFGHALERDAHHRAADVIRMVVRRERADDAHALVLDEVDELTRGVRGIDDHRLTFLFVADDVGKVDHLFGDRIVDGEVATGQQLAYVEAIVLGHRADDTRQTERRMSPILSTTPMPSVEGHVDATFTDRSAWSESQGATILPMMLGDDHCGPFIVLSYVEPSDEQMPLSFAHAHASDNWRISVRGTTNMGRDTYEQGQFRFHDGGVPYASDNFAWGPDGGFGIIMFADRRGFAIRPVKAEIAAKVTPEQEMAGKFLGIDMQDPCPGAPAIATTLGLTERAHLDGGFDSADTWTEIAPGVRMAAGLAGEPTAGPVLVFVSCAAGCEAVPAHTVATETVLAPVSGSVDAAGTTLAQGDVRVEDRDVAHPALVAGADGVELVLIFADRRGLRSALDTGTLPGPLGIALSTTLAQLQDQLPLAGTPA